MEKKLTLKTYYELREWDEEKYVPINLYSKSHLAYQQLASHEGIDVSLVKPDKNGSCSFDYYSVEKITVVVDEDGNVFKIDPKPILVDLPTIDQVTAKLSEKELFVMKRGR